MQMKSTWLGVLVLGYFVSAANAQGNISSLAIGVYDTDEKPLLTPAFINSVNGYLHRYEPKLIEKGAEHVKMQIDYDYIYEVELTVSASEFEIKVTLAEKTNRTAKAQAQAAKLSSGVLRAMENSLMRSSRVRDRTHRNSDR